MFSLAPLPSSVTVEFDVEASTERTPATLTAT